MLFRECATASCSADATHRYHRKCDRAEDWTDPSAGRIPGQPCRPHRHHHPGPAPTLTLREVHRACSALGLLARPVPSIPPQRRPPPPSLFIYRDRPAPAVLRSPSRPAPVPDRLIPHLLHRCPPPHRENPGIAEIRRHWHRQPAGPATTTGMPAARATHPARPRRTDAGTVKLTDRDITGLTLVADQYGAPHDLLADALGVKEERLRGMRTGCPAAASARVTSSPTFPVAPVTRITPRPPLSRNTRHPGESQRANCS